MLSINSLYALFTVYSPLVSSAQFFCLPNKVIQRSLQHLPCIPFRENHVHHCRIPDFVSITEEAFNSELFTPRNEVKKRSATISPPCPLHLPNIYKRSIPNPPPTPLFQQNTGIVDTTPRKGWIMPNGTVHELPIWVVFCFENPCRHSIWVIHQVLTLFP